MQELSHCKIFTIFRATKQVVIIKLAQAQNKILIGVTVTKCMHKHFSSKDHDFRNLTKFVLHFSEFSTNFDAIMNFSAKLKKNN